MKRKLSFLLVTVLLVSMLGAITAEAKTPKNFNPEGFPIVNEQITLKMFGRRAPVNGPFEELPSLRKYEEMTNINVEWEDVPTAGFAERRNLVFASNSLPDAFFRSAISPLDQVKYGSYGMLIPLEDLVDQYAPNLKALFELYPEIKQGITAPDGHIYAIPGMVTLKSALTNKHWANKKWLDTLGLEVPKTTDEFVEVLRAFRDNDPNGNGQKDEVPFTARHWSINGNGWGQLPREMGGSFGLEMQMGYSINIENDKVNIWVTDDRYKEMLQFLNKLYAEGLMDREVFTQKAADYVGKMASGKLGFFYDQTTNPFSMIEDQYVGTPQLVGPKGYHMASQSAIARDPGAFAITYSNKYPEATMRWIDYFYGDEGSILFRFGPEGETMYFDENGVPQYVDSIVNDPSGFGTAIGKVSAYPGGAAPHLINERNAGAINPPPVQEAQKALDPDLPKKVLGPPLFDEKTAKRVDTIRQDLDTYVLEQGAKFIAGELSFDQWDNYAKTIERMGLKELQGIYQKVYDEAYN